MNLSTAGKSNLRFFLPLLLLCLVCSSSLSGENLIYTPDNRFKITEKYNLRKRVNNRYEGYVYREIRGNLVKDDDGFFDGRFYVFEERTENERRAHFLEKTVPVRFQVNEQGNYSLDPDTGYPRLRSFPVFPRTNLEKGDTWRDYGEVMVDPRRNGLETRIQFFCEYRYDGEITYLGEEGHGVTAQYALRYKQGDDPKGDPDLSSVSGKHVVSIFLSNAGSLFMRDQVEDQYTFTGREIISYKGFVLTWMDSFLQLDRERIRQEVITVLEEGGIEGVVVTERAEGISLTLEHVRFKPDQAVVLPGEETRIGKVADILKTIQDRSFLVVGHTADVGSYESQYQLSVERARAIVKLLSSYNIDPDRFIYEGRAGTQPIAPNDTEEGRRKNRRVEIFILED